MSHSKSAALCGFYGYQNYGDSLMLSGLHHFLTSCGYKVESFSDKESLEGNDFRKKSPLDSDRIFIGGGGIVTPNFWFFKNNLDEKVERFSLINVGLTTEATPVLEKTNQKIELAVVRDTFSYQFASRYIPYDKIIYAPDISFLDVPAPVIKNKKKSVTVCLNYYIFKNFFSQSHRERIFAEKAIIELAAFISWLQEIGYHIILAPCQTAGDVNDNIISGVLNGFLNKKAEWVLFQDEIENCIKRSVFVISSRYHTSLFALKNSIPFLDITHHSKNANFLKDIGLKSFSCSFWSLELNSLKESFDKITKFNNLSNISANQSVISSESWTTIKQRLKV